MKQQTKSFTAILLCIILACSFFSCGEKKELQVFFYDKTTLVTSGEDVLVVGTADYERLELDTDTIDVLVLNDGIDGFAEIAASYNIGTVYIPDTEEYADIYDSSDAFVVRVEGNMSFGIGAASVSVMAGNTESSLMTKITLGDQRLLLCGSANSERIEELLQYETQPYTYINLTEAQKGIEIPLLEALKPQNLIFTGTEPYVDGYTILEDSITLKE